MIFFFKCTKGEREGKRYRRSREIEKKRERRKRSDYELERESDKE